MSSKHHIVILLFFILLLLGIWLFWPINTNLLSSGEHPMTFTQATEEIEKIKAEETSGINPLCPSVFLNHGKKTDKVIVFFHGFTNCPGQFEPLGKMLYDKGYNVVIRRMPHHGLADKMTTDLENLTAEEMTRYTDKTIDIASGLGEHVEVGGLSVGAVLSTWTIYNRSHIDTAILIAPNYHMHTPAFVTKPLTRLLLTLPNQFIWWDDKFKENFPGAGYAYPRYSTRALGEFLRISLMVGKQAAAKKPDVTRIIVVTNENDTSVSNDETARFVTRWQDQGVPVSTYTFPANLGFGHDIIAPDNPEQSAIVYPILVNLITNQ